MLGLDRLQSSAYDLRFATLHAQRRRTPSCVEKKIIEIVEKIPSGAASALAGTRQNTPKHAKLTAAPEARVEPQGTAGFHT
jgi:hypothetical protein